MNPAIEFLEQLYRETGKSLLAYFRRQPALASTAEDLVQDTFVRAFRQSDRLQAARSPRAFLFGIARHVGLDALRRMRFRFASEAEPESAAESPSDPRLDAMRTAIEALPEIHREPLLLKLRHELKYEEIAAILDVPVGTVRSRLHHAVALLRQTLQSTRDPEVRTSIHPSGTVHP